ncbi:MAG: 16S rRNA (uracil(1498)-N(3))-methyltransferase [Cyanothece sp. SIO1E1]|nr:16S rRNA (uracil(1498)-N(3))-methyltransferase [Cyanothece sp. SIO1E1]
MSQLQRLAIGPTQWQDQQIVLTLEQQHYLNRVLRLRGGDRFIAIDSKEQTWLAELTATGSEATILHLISTQTELPIAVTLVVALPKGSRFDEVVRQTTELGVTRIVPLLSDRTLLNPSTQKLERWRRIAREATEQSERSKIPTILDPTPYLQGLETWCKGCTGCYLCTARRSSPHLLASLSAQNWIHDDAQTSDYRHHVVIAIGPEGGWTDAEIEQAIALGYQPVSLGRRILRAVTAPLVAMTLTAAAVEF